MMQKIILPVDVPVEQQDYGLIEQVLLQVYIDNGHKLPLWPSIPRITGLDKTRILTVFCHNNGWREAEKFIPELAKKTLLNQDIGTEQQVVKSTVGPKSLAHVAKEEAKIIPIRQVASSDDRSSPLTDEELTCNESNLIYWLTYDEKYSPGLAKNAIMLVRKRAKNVLDRHMVNLLETEEVQQCLSRKNRHAAYGEGLLRSLMDVITKELGRKPTTTELNIMSMHICTPTGSHFRKHRLLGDDE